MSTDLRQLSEREQEILRLVATGATNQQIANELDISVNTVKVHLRNIFGKVGVASRTEATVYAMRQGFVPVAATSEATSIPQIVSDPELDAPAAEAAEPASADLAVADPLDLDQTEAVSTEEPIRIEGEPTVLPRARRTPLLLGLLGVVMIIGIVIASIVFVITRRQQATTTQMPQQPERWQSHAALLQPRSDFATAAVDEFLYVIGGITSAGPSDAVERFDLIKNVWVPITAKPTPVTQIEAATVGGRIYVPGGEDRTGKVLDSFETYDPRSERWEKLPVLPAPRSRYALASVEGRIYLFGGWDGTQYKADVFIYDPATRVWRTGTPMPIARRGAGAAVVGDRIYLVGGENQSGPLAVNQRYDPTDERADGQPWATMAPLPEAIASPAVAGIANLMIAFDPERRTAAEYVAEREMWIDVPVPANVGLSSRIVPLSVSVVLFGPMTTQPTSVNEYQVIYTTYLPSPR